MDSSVVEYGMKYIVYKCDPVPTAPRMTHGIFPPFPHFMHRSVSRLYCFRFSGPGVTVLKHYGYSVPNTNPILSSLLCFDGFAGNIGLSSTYFGGVSNGLLIGASICVLLGRNFDLILSNIAVVERCA